MLYADDTDIFGTDETNFQNNLDVFYEYAKMWILDITKYKTKELIFGTRNDDRFSFKIARVKSQSVRNSSIWGVVFTKIRSLCKARKHNYDQAKRVMHLLYKRIRNFDLPIDSQLQLF